MVHAASGEDALQAAQQDSFDLILMDVCLPGISGEDATRALRQMNSCEKVPIIAVTAHALSSETERILTAGFDQLITKPIEEESLLQTIKEIIVETP